MIQIKILKSFKFYTDHVNYIDYKAGDIVEYNKQVVDQVYNDGLLEILEYKKKADSEITASDKVVVNDEPITTSDKVVVNDTPKKKNGKSKK